MIAFKEACDEAGDGRNGMYSLFVCLCVCLFGCMGAGLGCAGTFCTAAMDLPVAHPTYERVKGGEED